MPHQRLPDLDPVAVEQGEEAGRKPRLGDGAVDGMADQLRRGGMVGMRLDDDRAARRKSRRRIAARDREREREVAGGEHRDRPQREQHAADIRARRGRPIGERRVDDGLDVRALAQQRAELAELAGRAAPLAGEPGRSQRGLFVSEGDQIVAQCLDLGGDAIEKIREPGGGEMPRLLESGLCLGDGVVDLRLSRVGEDVRAGDARARVDAGEGRGPVPAGLSGDKLRGGEVKHH